MKTGYGERTKPSILLKCVSELIWTETIGQHGEWLAAIVHPYVVLQLFMITFCSSTPTLWPHPHNDHTHIFNHTFYPHITTLCTTQNHTLSLFSWQEKSTGKSNACSNTYAGPSAASEMETQHVVNYFRLQFTKTELRFWLALLTSYMYVHACA